MLSQFDQDCIISVNNPHFPSLRQVDEIEALQSKCKEKVKNQSKRLKEISSRIKLAISEEQSALRATKRVSLSADW